MDQAHEQAEQSRQHLTEMGIQASFFEASKNLSSHYHESAIQACDYDPLYTNAQVPLPQNEQYLFLLSLSMKDGAQGAWAKEQLDAIHGIIGQASQAASGILTQLGAGNTSEAWRGFIQFVSLQQQLGKYHLFPPEASKEQAQEEEKHSWWESVLDTGDDVLERVKQSLHAVSQPLDKIEAGVDWLEEKVGQGEQWLYDQLDQIPYNENQLDESFKKGIVKGVIGTVAGVLDLGLEALTSQPRQWNYIINVIATPDPALMLKQDMTAQWLKLSQLPGQIKAQAKDTWTDFKQADNNQKAETAGLFTEKILELFIPWHHGDKSC